jgi:hypothetical protein
MPEPAQSPDQSAPVKAGVDPKPDDAKVADAPPTDPPREIGGRKGPEPTRYGDWEYKGRCIDF